MTELAAGMVLEFKDRKTKEQVVDPKKGRKWQIVISLPGHIDKSQKRPRKYYVFYGSRRKAEEEKDRLVFEFCEKLKRSIITTEVVIKEDRNITFGEYALQWINAQENVMKRNTWETYRRYLKVHIVPALGHIQLLKIAPAHISQYRDMKLSRGRRDGKTGGLSKETVNKHLAVVSVVLESAAAIERGLIPYNYALLVKRAKGETSKKDKSIDSSNAAAVNCYWQDELNHLLSLLGELYSYRRLKPEDKTPEVIKVLLNLGFSEKEAMSQMALYKIKTDKLYPIVYLAARTGMRISELVALTWDDVYFKDKFINVYASLHHGEKKEGEEHTYFFNTTKEGKVKSHITITDDDVMFLKEHRKTQFKERQDYKRREYHDLNFVFCSNNGLPMHSGTVSRAFTDFIKSNNLRPITFHGLRHSHCSILLAQGVPWMYVAQRLGHASFTTQAKYSHVRRDGAPNLGDIFDRAMKGNFIDGDKVVSELYGRKLLDEIDEANERNRRMKIG